MVIQVRTLRALLLYATILCPAVAIIAGLLANPWPLQRGLIFYIAPLFFIGPLWLRMRVGERPLQWETLWALRSEERRVGKECRSGWSAEQCREKYGSYGQVREGA